MSAYTTLRTTDGECHRLSPGGIVGRLRSADLRLADPRVSEAHALLSLRGLELRLLGLRGRFSVDGRVVDEIALSPGMTLAFAPGLEVDVVDVVVPDVVLAIEGPSLPPQVLSGVCSLYLGPPPRLVERYAGDADAWLHWDGSFWWLRTRTGEPRSVDAGDAAVVGGSTFTIRAIPVRSSPTEATEDGAVRAPMRIEARFESVSVLRNSRPTVVLSGLGARIISELVTMGGPVPWLVLARQLWPEEEDPNLLRGRWDVALLRLRRKLRDARLPEDLVRADRNGFLELVIETKDEVVDLT